MSEVVETIERAGYVASVCVDMGPSSPADWCNYGTIAYDSGNGAAGDMPNYWRDYGLENCLPDARMILPLKTWDDRNGTELTVADDWGSANGFIYSTGECSCGCGASHADVSDADLRAGLLSELKSWQQWAQGDVYGAVITNPAGEEIDACWGFYGYGYALEEAARMLDLDAVRLLEASPALADVIIC